LLLTNDSDVLRASLNLLLRLIQQYGSTIPVEKPLLRNIKSRLTVLARGSESIRSNNIELKTLASADTIAAPEGASRIPISFYPTQADKASKTGSSTITFELQGSPAQSVVDQVLAATEGSYMGVEDQFDLLNRARWVAALGEPKERHKMVACRLLSISILCEWSASGALR
jgi:hypothetical protein